MAKTNDPTAVTVPQVQPERANFHKLIAANPNYFGNIANSPFPPVVQIQNNTSFEEVTCIGFNPVTNILETVTRSSGQTDTEATRAQMGRSSMFAFS